MMTARDLAGSVRFTCQRAMQLARGGIAVACAGIGLAACVTPSTDYPVIGQADIERETLVDQSNSVTARLDRQARLNAISWPLLVANTDLCHDRRIERFGFTIGNDRSIRDLADGFTLAQVNALGYDSSPIVLNIFPGSPAAQAGLERGAIPVRVAGIDIGGDMAALGEALSEYRKSRDAAKEKRKTEGEAASELPNLTALFSLANGEALEINIAPELVCDIPVNVAETDAVNASTGGRKVNMNRGLLARLERDEDVAIILGHEIGHVIGEHVPKQRRNSFASGFAVWGVPVGIGAGLFDSLFAGALERWAGVETPPGQAGMVRLANASLGIRDFEREADYLGMYVAARAGTDLSNAENVFETFAKLSPRSTYGHRTHPITAERRLALGAAREEIETKRAAGDQLIPNGWPYPVPLREADVKAPDIIEG